jgi:hypothetical protein
LEDLIEACLSPVGLSESEVLGWSRLDRVEGKDGLRQRNQVSHHCDISSGEDRLPEVRVVRLSGQPRSDNQDWVQIEAVSKRECALHVLEFFTRQGLGD